MAKTKWSIEKWTDVLRSATPQSEAYNALGLRELVIISCAELDIALAELLSKRLCGDQGEINDFLGADADGRAPGGSFGARIQLAYLIGLIDATEMALLRDVKKLRNDFAHKVLCKWEMPRIRQTSLDLFGCVLRIALDRGIVHGSIKPYSRNCQLPEMKVTNEESVKSFVALGTDMMRDRFSQLYKRMPRVKPLPSWKGYLENLARQDQRQELRFRHNLELAVKEMEGRPMTAEATQILEHAKKLLARH